MLLIVVDGRSSTLPAARTGPPLPGLAIQFGRLNRVDWTETTPYVIISSVCCADGPPPVRALRM